MANRYFVGGGTGNWNSTTNWSDTDGGASGFSVPTLVDDVFLTAASGANTLIVNVDSVCKSINCTGFTGTLSGSSLLTIAGDVTIVPTMTLTFTGTFIVSSLATLTSNSKIYTGSISLQNSTITFFDDWHIIGNISSSNSIITGGKTISVEGNVSVPTNNNTPALHCTIKFVGAANQTLSTVGAFICNVLIDKSGGNFTMLDATISGIRFYGLSFVVSATNLATITAPTLISTNASSVSFDTNTINWNNFTNKSATITLVSSLYILGTITYSSSSAVNGSDLFIGSLRHTGTGTAQGSSNIHFIYGGIWEHTSTGVLINNVVINTAGILTLGSAVQYRTGTLTHIAGTVDATTNNSTLIIGASTTLNTAGITWNNISFTGASAVLSLTNSLSCTGTFTMGANNGTINGSTLTVSGSISYTQGSLVGTTSIVMNGTGTLSCGATTYAIKNNLTINTSGTITFGSIVNVSSATLTCTAGTVDTTTNLNSFYTNSTETTVLNFTPSFYTVRFLGTVTFNSNITAVNLVITSSTVINGNTLYMTGDMTFTNNLSGTTNIEYIGTGTWTGSASGGYYLRNNLTINTAGTFIISGTASYGTGTITYVSGTVNASGSTLLILASPTLNTAGIVWDNINIGVTSTIALTSPLTFTGTMTMPNQAVTFTGSGITGGTYSMTAALAATRVVTLVSGVTYTFNAIEITGATNTNKYRFVSSIGGSRANLVIPITGTQNLIYVDATDIDSSAGQTVWSFQQVISNTLNWGNLNASNIGGAGIFTFAN